MSAIKQCRADAAIFTNHLQCCISLLLFRVAILNEPTVFQEDSEFDDLDNAVYRRPRSLDHLVANTHFTRMELKRLYRDFKAECPVSWMPVWWSSCLSSVVSLIANSNGMHPHRPAWLKKRRSVQCTRNSSQKEVWKFGIKRETGTGLTVRSDESFSSITSDLGDQNFAIRV